MKSKESQARKVERLRAILSRNGGHSYAHKIKRFKEKDFVTGRCFRCRIVHELALAERKLSGE